MSEAKPSHFVLRPNGGRTEVPSGVPLLVQDIVRTDVFECEYDLAIYACGFEQRSIHLASAVGSPHAKERIVLGFTEYTTAFAREKNEQFFRKQWPDAWLTLGANEDKPLYKRLQQFITSRHSPDKIRILVDYSSMSRVWYNAIFNWIRHIGQLPPIEVDFVYSRGEYVSEYHPLIIRDILALPGCEVSIRLNRATTALFGLGFDSTVALSVVDRLEPNTIYAFFASPGTLPGYDEKARRLNKILMDEADRVYPLPIANVGVALRLLREIAAPDIGRNNVFVVPLGPKPHVLAAILLSRVHEGEIGCLRAGGHRSSLVDVVATGEFIATRVHF